MSRHDGLTIRAVTPSVALLLACAAAWVCLGIPAAAQAAEPALAGDFAAYWEGQWDLLNKHIEWSRSETIKSGPDYEFLRPTRLVDGVPNLPYPAEAPLDPARVYRDHHCLIWESDRDALDILLRRTEALVEHLKEKFQLGLDEESASLDAIRSQAHEVSIGDPQRKQLFLRACALQRQLALKNPLLDFDEILFMNGHLGTGMTGTRFFQYIQFSDHIYNEKPRDEIGLYGPMVLSHWKTPQPSVRRLLPDRFRLGDAGVDLASPVKDGAVSRSVSFHAVYDLSFDGKTLLFAAGKPTCIYRFDLESEKVLQLTDGTFASPNPPRNFPANSGFPCWLPDGRIAFASERDGKADRCGGVVTTLWAMAGDGSDAHPISWHETHDSHPVVDCDGRLIYSRWDYVDRGWNAMHNMWSCFPDGRDPRAVHGNYAFPHCRGDPPWQYLHPGAEYHIRPVPGEPGRYVAIAGTHHIALLGVPILINTNRRDDHLLNQVQILVGHMLPTERYATWRNGPAMAAKRLPGGQDRGKGLPAPGFGYLTPWPLSSDFQLISDLKDLVLLDHFGNVVPLLVWDGPGPVCSPRPFRARQAPPDIPVQTWQGERRGGAGHLRATISIQNVYDADFAWPGVAEEKRIKALRVIQIVPKPAFVKSTQGPSFVHRMVLGTVPVEEDGSVYFEAPVEKELIFQVLDARGMAVQSMKSGTYVHPGEHLSCQGCHEDKHRSPPSRTVGTAMRRPPSVLAPDVDGSLPLNFARLVQPVFEHTCMPCHKKEGKGPVFNLDDPKRGAEMRRAVPGCYQIGARYEDAGPGYRSQPYAIGAHASGIGRGLLKSHLDRVTPDEFHRVVLWLDCNSMDVCAHHDREAQARGEIVWPIIECDPVNPQGVERDRPVRPAKPPDVEPTAGAGERER